MPKIKWYSVLRYREYKRTKFAKKYGYEYIEHDFYFYSPYFLDKAEEFIGKYAPRCVADVLFKQSRDKE